MTFPDKVFIAFLKSFTVGWFGIERREIAKNIKREIIKLFVFAEKNSHVTMPRRQCTAKRILKSWLKKIHIS